MTPIVFDKVDKEYFIHYQKTLKELAQAILNRGKIREKIHALKNISLTINKGETIGIIGRNGAGKSTMLKLIAGVSQPTRGELSVNGRVSPLIELGSGFHPELTGRENIFLNGVILGLTEKEVKDSYKEIVTFSELNDTFIHMPVKQYSSGMFMRLAFSVAIHSKPDILLVDEILAVGDTNFQEKCLKKMEAFKKKGITIIFVSHSMQMIQHFCPRVVYLKNGEVQYDGETKKGVELYSKES